MKTVVGLYDEIEDARSAVYDLVDADFDYGDISLVSLDPEGKYAAFLEAHEEELVDVEADEAAGVAAEGAATGGVIGGLVGLLVGAASLTIPGLGPIIALGPLVTGIFGAGAGAVTGGLIKSLAEVGVPEGEAEIFAEGVRRGGVLLAVKTREDRLEEANRIMEEYGPVDMDERAASWREAGWDVHDKTGGAYSPAEREAFAQGYEETFAVDAEGAEWGDFTIYEDDFREHFSSTYGERDLHYWQFRAAYRYGYDLATDARYRDDEWETVVPEAKERWHELKDEDLSWEAVEAAVRFAWDTVKPYVTGEDTKVDGFEVHDVAFREHYSELYGDAGREYSRYEPAYRYGYGLATDPRYRDLDWDEVEENARRGWEERREGSWEEYSDAVIYAFNRMKTT